MLTKRELGRRLRRTRFERGLTLKDVAARCGMSATHISEVERGKTSPTIGALQRIAKALGQEPSFFVREDSVPKVVVTRAKERADLFLSDKEGRPLAVNVLSPGLSGGALQIFERSVAPGARISVDPRIGEMVVLCLQGMVRITAGSGESHVLREGDTIHLRLDSGYASENVGEDAAEIVAFVASPRPFTI
jgi:transcriptional regulator with XRE-family HTH domain